MEMRVILVVGGTQKAERGQKMLAPLWKNVWRRACRSLSTSLSIITDRPLTS